MSELVNAYINWQLCELGQVPNGNLDAALPRVSLFLLFAPFPSFRCLSLRILSSPLDRLHLVRLVSLIFETHSLTPPTSHLASLGAR